MWAEVGDEVEVGSTGSTRQGRIGTIVAVQGGGDSPHYLIHWLADYESLITPGPGERIEVHHRTHGEPLRPPLGRAAQPVHHPSSVR
jgi:Domain of unknown function (DUF1918)